MIHLDPSFLTTFNKYSVVGSENTPSRLVNEDRFLLEVIYCVPQSWLITLKWFKSESLSLKKKSPESCNLTKQGQDLSPRLY